MQDDIQVTTVKHDINGNPRRVVHFLAFITEADRKAAPADHTRIGRLYDLALARSRAIGGRKFHNRQFGGGIVFQSYSDNELRKDIAGVMAGVAIEQARDRIKAGILAKYEEVPA
jgi:hypothetical protein